MKAGTTKAKAAQADDALKARVTQAGHEGRGHTESETDDATRAMGHTSLPQGYMPQSLHGYDVGRLPRLQ